MFSFKASIFRQTYERADLPNLQVHKPGHLSRKAQKTWRFSKKLGDFSGQFLLKQETQSAF